MFDLKTIRTVRAVIRALKKGDVEFVEKAFADAPEEVRERIKKIIGVYKEAEEGKVSREEAAKAIAKEIGLGGNLEDVEDLIGLIEDLLGE